VEAKDSPLISTELPLSVRIKEILKRGPMTAKEIEQELDVKENTLRATLKRLKDHNVTVKIGEQCALRTLTQP
jgi:predicted transcriptional regulator